MKWLGGIELACGVGECSLQYIIPELKLLRITWSVEISWL